MYVKEGNNCWPLQSWTVGLMPVNQLEQPCQINIVEYKKLIVDIH